LEKRKCTRGSHILSKVEIRFTCPFVLLQRVVVIWEMPMHHSFVTPKLFDFSFIGRCHVASLLTQKKKKTEIGERNQVLRREHAMLNQSKQVNNGGCLPPVAATSPSSVVAAVVFPHGRMHLPEPRSLRPVQRLLQLTRAARFTAWCRPYSGPRPSLSLLQHGLLDC
jgi:hypothetical protein